MSLSLDQAQELARLQSKELAQSATTLWRLVGSRKSIDTIALHEQRVIAAKKVRRLVDEVGDLINQIAGFETDSPDVGGPVLKYHP